MEPHSASFLREYNRAILSCLVGGREGIEFGLSLGDAYSGLVFPLRLTGTERKQAAVHIPVLLFVENHQCYSGLYGNLGKQRAGLIPVGGIGRIIVQHLTPAGFNTPVDRVSLTGTASSSENCSGIVPSFWQDIPTKQRASEVIIIKCLTALIV